jgi:hypothetical protein
VKNVLQGTFAEEMNEYVPYEPGVLPSSPAPSAGDEIALRVEGLPPYKDEHFSIRNARHKIHSRFTDLRQAAIHAMAGRAPYRGAVRLDFLMHASEFERARSLVDYVGGIMDTLDGSHGTEFTYLPIVYEDDCQVAEGQSRLVEHETPWYEVRVVFLGEGRVSEQVAPADA